jgi:hypothetical protein
MAKLHREVGHLRSKVLLLAARKYIIGHVHVLEAAYSYSGAVYRLRARECRQL